MASSYVNNTYAKIVDEMILRMETCAKTHEPWFNASIPCNVKSNRPYNRINRLALQLSAMRNGFRNAMWGTYNNFVELGYEIPKGTKATQVFFFKPAQEDSPFVWRVYNVFNAEQVGMPSTEGNTVVVSNSEIDAFVTNTGAEIKENLDKAAYSPKMDVIYVPFKFQFPNTECYYATLFHELVHWTGHESRLDRELNTGKFGDSAYAVEELIAELGAVFLGASFGISPSLREDHASYLKSWISVLRENPMYISKIASQAQNAADYLLD